MVFLPVKVSQSLCDDPIEWQIQIGRRIGQVTECRCHEVDVSDTDIRCELDVDWAGSRTDRLSTDEVFPEGTDKENVFAVYSEVAAAWRQLTDVRFRLLAFLPIVSGIGFLQLISPDAALSSAPRWAKGVAAGFGLVITCALLIYERRNSELYDDLISRGKHLENWLGAQSGVFLGRLKARWPLQHDVAILGIYWATLFGWLILLVAVLSGLLGS